MVPLKCAKWHYYNIQQDLPFSYIMVYTCHFVGPRVEHAGHAHKDVQWIWCGLVECVHQADHVPGQSFVVKRLERSLYTFI